MPQVSESVAPSLDRRPGELVKILAFLIAGFFTAAGGEAWDGFRQWTSGIHSVPAESVPAAEPERVSFLDLPFI